MMDIRLAKDGEYSVEMISMTMHERIVKATRRRFFAYGVVAGMVMGSIIIAVLSTLLRPTL